MPEYDARDVLEKSVAMLGVGLIGEIREVSELPYPKDVIKAVLRHSIELLTSRGREKELLKIACQNIADYQPLTAEERRAVTIMKDVGERGEVGSERLNELAHLLAKDTLCLSLTSTTPFSPSSPR